MASNYTENYNLCQWEATDQVLRTEFNEDNTKIDAVLTSIQTILNGKGNCQMWTTTYKGTGGYGTNSFNYLTFPARPLMVGIFNTTGPEYMFLTYGMGAAYVQSIPLVRNQVQWEENTVRWCLHDISDALGQMNAGGYIYRVVAILENT